MIGTITKKLSGIDFDANDFVNNNFEVDGWGWRGKLSRIGKLRGLMIKNV